MASKEETPEALTKDFDALAGTVWTHVVETWARVASTTTEKLGELDVVNLTMVGIILMIVLVYIIDNLMSLCGNSDDGKLNGKLNAELKNERPEEVQHNAEVHNDKKTGKEEEEYVAPYSTSSSSISPRPTSEIYDRGSSFVSPSRHVSPSTPVRQVWVPQPSPDLQEKLRYTPVLIAPAPPRTPAEAARKMGLDPSVTAFLAGHGAVAPLNFDTPRKSSQEDTIVSPIVKRTKSALKRPSGHQTPLDTPARRTRSSLPAMEEEDDPETDRDPVQTWTRARLRSWLRANGGLDNEGSTAKKAKLMAMVTKRKNEGEVSERKRSKVE